MLPDLKATKGWITDKPEGVAITSSGRTFVVTDNDGVEDWSGETWFLILAVSNNYFLKCAEGRAVSIFFSPLRTGFNDEAVSVSGKDCFAPLAMT